MTSRRGRSLTRMVTVERVIPGKMEPIGRVCHKNTSPPPSLPWTAIFPFSGESAVLFGVWKGFFLESKGLVSPCQAFFPASVSCLPLDKLEEAALLDLASRLSSVLSFHTTTLYVDLVVPTQPPMQFLRLSCLCPNVWELHRDVYICLSEEPRK